MGGGGGVIRCPVSCERNKITWLANFHSDLLMRFHENPVPIIPQYLQLKRHNELEFLRHHLLDLGPLERMFSRGKRVVPLIFMPNYNTPIQWRTVREIFGEGCRSF